MLHACTHGANPRIISFFMHPQNSLLGNLAFRDAIPLPLEQLHVNYFYPLFREIFTYLVPGKLFTASEQMGSSMSVVAALYSTCHLSEVSLRMGLGTLLLE